jgi:dihydroorotase (multifunctional complex type)
MSDAFDLAIEGGTVVTRDGRADRHVYVRDGRIAAVSEERRPADERVDAAGLLVMPGMIDVHVHLMDPGDPTREDFPTGTAAAAAAGITTLVEHTHARPVVTGDDLAAKREYLSDRARIDFGLAAHAQPDREDEIAGVWGAGAVFLKIFTCTTHGLVGFDAAQLRRTFAAAADAGAFCLVHAEDEAVTADREAALRSAGREDGGVISEWRHPDAELLSLAAVRVLASRTGARAGCAHVSSIAALDELGDAGVIAESCPQYLLLREDELREHGALRKFTPPARARAQADLDAMWSALADGRIDYISSDHAPSTLEQKQAGSIWDVHFGLPGLDTTFPVLLDAAATGRLTYERVVDAYSQAPARIYGLAPRKGSLAPGADADIVLVDPAARWTVRDSDVISRAGWSPYRGRTLTGHAVATYLRGQLVARGREVLAEPGTGRFVPGSGA